MSTLENNTSLETKLMTQGQIFKIDENTCVKESECISIKEQSLGKELSEIENLKYLKKQRTLLEEQKNVFNQERECDTVVNRKDASVNTEELFVCKSESILKQFNEEYKQKELHDYKELVYQFYTQNLKLSERCQKMKSSLEKHRDNTMNQQSAALMTLSRLVNPYQFSVISSQVLNQDKSPSNRLWAAHMKKMAVNLHQLSPEAYSFLSKILLLPTVQEISMWKKHQFYTDNSEIIASVTSTPSVRIKQTSTCNNPNTLSGELNNSGQLSAPIPIPILPPPFFNGSRHILNESKAISNETMIASNLKTAMITSNKQMIPNETASFLTKPGKNPSELCPKNSHIDIDNEEFLNEIQFDNLMSTLL